MFIKEIKKSNRKDKRFNVIMSDNSSFHFGLKDGLTFIDHKDEVKKKNYIKRHMANKKENYLISNLIPSPALFSMYILWGKYNNIN